MVLTSLLGQVGQVTNYQTTYQPEEVSIIPVLIMIFVFMAIAIAIMALVAWLISSSLAAVPEQYRQNITPGQVWLLLIPIFALVWNFIVFQRVPATFKAYFESTGRPQPGDYGKSLGLAYAICAACSVIPCIGSFTGLAALVLLIILIVKFVGYKNMILAGGGGSMPTQLPPAPPQV